MKKLVVLTAAVALTLFASCKENKEEVPATPPTVEDPAPPPSPEPTVNTTETEDEDGTSISINNDGVSVKDKNGKNESNVTITDDKKGVEIKRD